MKKVVIADAQYLTRVGLTHLVSELSDFEVVATTMDWNKTVKACREKQADVLLLDHLQLHHFSWTSLQELLQQQPIHTVVISQEDTPAVVHTALGSGIQSFLTKGCSAAEIRNAIHAIMAGEKFFCNKVLDVIFSKHYTPELDNCAPTSLSDREMEIVTLLVDGKNSKAIAEELCLSLHTVYTHRKNIMRKLKVRSVQELVSHALQSGLVAK